MLPHRIEKEQKNPLAQAPGAPENDWRACTDAAVDEEQSAAGFVADLAFCSIGND